MDENHDNAAPKEEKDADLSHLTEGRMEEIHQVFRLLGIEKNGVYPGAYEFSKQLQKASKLQYEGVIFTTSSSSLSPFKIG